MMKIGRGVSVKRVCQISLDGQQLIDEPAICLTVERSCPRHQIIAGLKMGKRHLGQARLMPDFCAGEVHQPQITIGLLPLDQSVQTRRIGSRELRGL